MPTINPILRPNDQGDQVKTVQTNLTKLGLTLPATETRATILGCATSGAIAQFQASAHLPVTGKVDAITQAMLANAAAVTGTTQSQVGGSLVMDYGLPANGVTVRLYSIGYGGAATKLAEAKTDANGVYSLAYTPPASGANVQVRVVDAKGNETSVSAIIYNPPTQLPLNLVAPASVQPLTAEFDRLAAAVQGVIGGTGLQNLAAAQESDTQRDLTLLNQSTGWDARLLALAATAAQQAATSGLGADVLYALFRVGFPTDPQALALVPPATIGTALTNATQAGVVNLTTPISAAQSAFAAYATKINLARKVPGAPSTVRDFIGNTLTDANQQQAFLNLVFDPTVKGVDLWSKAAAAGIPVATIDTLKLQGKLSLLTFNNAPLAARLQQQLGSTANLSQLADKDYHLDATWTILLNSVAGNTPGGLQTLVPSIYGGATPAARLEAYAADLARKVRVSFPTRVVARMVENNSLPLPASVPGSSGGQRSSAQPSVAQSVVSFLRTADTAGYKLGKTPLNAFLKNPPRGVTVTTDPSTLKWIRNLHRLYQITPSNESLQAAVKLGFTSARDIAVLPPDRFLAIYGSSFPSMDEASQVHRKATQVNAVVVNLFASAKLLDTLPPMNVLNTSPTAVQNAKNAVIQQYPTMATLFGSQDYCECQDCQSVLSPAAYLVSILQFIDDGTPWQAFLAAWKNAHNSQAYPNGTPFSVLAGRRPDLPNLNLSCENTNTALPYIDLVNEILEYFTAHGHLDSTATHDTGSAASADLIAEPQYVLQPAYSILSNQNSKSPALYPLGLPFDLWIETVRGFLGYFNITLAQVLDVFRPADNLELFTDSKNYPYYRASIFAEALGICPAEYALFTDATALQDWYKFYGYAVASTASTALGSSAKTLANTLGVSYQDLANLAASGFVNPGLAPLTRPLQSNGLSLNDVFAYTHQPGFTSSVSIPAVLQPWLNSLLTTGYSNKVLVLQAPSSNACDFQDTKFQYAGGNPADPLTWLKLNFFERLWKKLGWSMDELDQALQVFLTPLIPASADPTFGADLSSAMKTALVYLSHLQELFGKLQPGPYGRIGILPLWANIPTTGANPLYAQIFLIPGVLNSDPIFDDPAGQYLCYYDTASNKYLPFRWSASQTADDPPHGYVLLGNHSTALQGALGLTANDIAAILADNGLSLASAPLTLSNVSLLYRYAFLSQALQVSVSDLIALKQMSGLNPFAPLKAAPLAVLADDAPWNQTLQFVDVTSQVQSSGFAVGQLQYLLSQYDPTGQYSPNPGAQLQQLAATAAAIQAIRTQNAIPADPSAFTDDLIRQKMAQVFPAAVAQTFMGMWSGTLQYTATTQPLTVTPANSIPSGVLPTEPQILLSFDPVTGTQSLVYQGVLVDADLTRITGEITALVTAGTLTALQQTRFQGLLSQVRSQALTFFQTYLQLASGAPAYGFLPAGDFDLLFTPPLGSAAARQELAARFLPYLQQSLISQYLIQTTASYLGASAALAADFLTNTAVLADPTQPASPGTTLLSALQAAADTGLSVTYYSDASETTLLASGATATLASADTSLADTTRNPPVPKPAGVNSVHFEGYLVVPADGPYSFTAVLPNPTALANLQFDFMSSPLIFGLGTASGSPVTYTASKFAQFKAGIPYHFTLDFQNLGGANASLLVQGETLPQGALGQLTLYPERSVERYNRANLLLTDTFQLVSGFGLDENEVLYITSNSADFDNLSFSALPTQLSDTFTPNPTLFGQFLRLANYASLRQGPAHGTDALIGLFQQARQTFAATTPQPANQALAAFCQAADALTNRVAGTVQATVTQLWGSAVATSVNVGAGAQAQVRVTLTPLVNDLGFLRLWKALQLVQTLGVQPAVLRQTTAIVSPSRAASTPTPPSPDPGYAIAGQLENAIKSFYGPQPQTWRTIAQSIFNPLRQKKRDALCAYILTQQAIQQFGATDTNGLFEYFLVDPGMEPVVQASRIQLAIASVQTFIQRCLLNLEPMVNPSAVNSDQWAWMKRYRVWGANREIFLWPENWLIPEFREDATDLFQAMESTLLQGDITEDLVETAFNQYLQDLDARARVDIVTMYNQPPSSPGDSNVFHVIGRNHGKPPKYFYRTYANGAWTGWTPVTADIEGDHIAALVWRGRLTVFWLTFVLKGGGTVPQQQSSTDKGVSGNTPLTSMNFNDLFNQVTLVGVPPNLLQIQLNWSEYFQGQWSPRKSSDINRFTPIRVDNPFDPKSDIYIHVSIDNVTGTSAATSTPDPVEAAVIHLDGPATATYPINSAFRLTSKNSEPVFLRSPAFPTWQQAWTPYNNSPNLYYDASKYVGYDASARPAVGASNLNVNLPAGYVANNDGSYTQLQPANQQILQDVNSFTLLQCDNLVPAIPIAIDVLGFQIPLFYIYQVGSLITPFFYQDGSDPGNPKELSFFVQPSLLQEIITTWNNWVLNVPSDTSFISGGYWNNLQVKAQVPAYGPVNPPDPESVYTVQPRQDWVTQPETLVSFKSGLVSNTGGVARLAAGGLLSPASRSAFTTSPPATPALTAPFRNPTGQLIQ